MAIESKGEIARNMGVRLGVGVCGILGSFREASREYDSYYDNKDSKGVADYVFKAANTIGKGAVRGAGLVGRTVGAALKSEPAQHIKSGVMSAYESLREKYSEYLNKSSEQLANERAEKELSGEGPDFSLKFQTFLNSTAKLVNKGYSKGENIIKNAAKGIGETARAIAGSEAYKKLAGIAGAGDDKQAEDNNLERE